MNPLLSYLRHVIVIGVFYLVEKYKLPVEGVSEAINWIALTLVTSIAWVVAKYGKELKIKLLTKKGVLPLLLGSCFFLLPSCTADQRAAFPITIGITTPEIEARYSAKGGLELVAILDRRESDEEFSTVVDPQK